MNYQDAALAGFPGGPAAFAAVTDLLAIIANPAAAQARLEALQAKIADLAEGRTALDAERAVVGQEIAEQRQEIAEQRAFAGRMMAAAKEEKATAEGLRETAEAYAEKVGYRERPSVVPVGGGLTMSTFGEEPPRPATAEPSPSRVSDERFGLSSLTRQADDEAATSASAIGFRGPRARRGA